MKMYLESLEDPKLGCESGCIKLGCPQVMKMIRRQPYFFSNEQRARYLVELMQLKILTNRRHAIQ
ncbi:hypothetical protein D1872_314070 [compost metagenome]